MSEKRLFVFAGVLGALLLAGCNKGDDGPRAALPAENAPFGEKQPPAVESPEAATKAAVQVTPDETPTRLTGATESNRKSVIASKISGIVDSVLVQEGDRVEEGATLVKLDTKDLQLAVKQAQAALRSARVQVKTTDVEMERFSGLLADKAIPQRQYDLVKAQADAADAGVQQARVALERAQKTVADAVITAPYDGVITSRRINEGEFAAAMPPTPLVIIEELDPIVVRLQVPAVALSRVQTGAPVEVRIPSIDKTIRGTVARTVPSLNPATQTASALVELPNPEGELRPGLYAEATLLADEARPAPTAERDAHAETPRREAREESTP